MKNLLLATDSYKLTHWDQYPPGTEYVYSYFESRPSATYPTTVFFGLQYLLYKLSGSVVDEWFIEDTAELAAKHFGNPNLFNREGWEHIIDKHDGHLPLEIHAVPEGSEVPINNVLMTVVNTDPKCYWLTNYVESLLTHVWYPSTVATLSKYVKKMMMGFLDRTCDVPGEVIYFMLHDFGYRGATCDEAAALGGAGHLTNFWGTDTLLAMELLHKYYEATYDSLAFSVPATEHSVMTARGPHGEYEVLDQVLANYPTGILSVVGDSYDIYAFTEQVIARKHQIISRDGRFVLRPDSTTDKNPLPHSLVLSLMDMLWEGFGGQINSKGFRVLDTHVRVLWGDGIEPDGIRRILDVLENNGYSAENIVFGMGGGLLQKVNRDTQSFAFKCSAQYRNGEWVDVFKTTPSKASKAGRLSLIKDGDKYQTVRHDEPHSETNLLELVFKNGRVVCPLTLDDVRKNNVLSELR